MKLYLFALGAFAFAASCAHTAQTASTGPAGRDCFNSSFLSGYTDVDNDTIRVSAGPSRDYDLDIEGVGCRDIRWSETIAIDSPPSSWICVGDKVGAGEIKFRDSARSTVTSCFIRDVRRYVKPASATPAQ